MKLLKLLPRYDLNLSDSNAVASTGEDTGNTAISSFDPQGTAGAQQTSLGTSGLSGLLNPETSSAVGGLASAVANNPSVTSLYNQANQQFGVPQLTATNQYYQNALNNIIPNSYQAAKGYDIDQSDLANSQALASQYLGPQANQAQSNLNAAQGLASNFVQAGQAQNAQNLLAPTANVTLTQQMEAEQASGWNQTLSSEFQGLIDKMDQGVTLSSAELSRANTLATAEEAYQQNLANLSAVPVTQNANLVNTLTGTMINPTQLNTTGSYKLA